MNTRFLPRYFRFTVLLPHAAGALLIAGTLAACTALPSAPQAPAVYDFGPPPAMAAKVGAGERQASSRRPLILESVAAPGLATDALAVQYRQSFAGGNRLRAYQQARWSQPPGQLLEQRLRHALQAERPVLGGDVAVTRIRDAGAYPAVLKVEVLAFEQVFSSPEQSEGHVSARATLLQPRAAGDVLLGQQTFARQTPARSADAAGGAQALAQSAQAIAQDIDAWVGALGQ